MLHVFFERRHQVAVDGQRLSLVVKEPRDHEDNQLFEHSYTQILQQFRIAKYRIGLLELVINQACHNGASLDYQGKFRDILDVTKQSWASDSNLLQYKNVLLLNKLAYKLTAKQLSIFNQAARSLEGIFFSRKESIAMHVCPS